MNTNQIDQQQFRLIVTASQGMTKVEMIDRLSVDKDRMNRAQKKGVENCWLFVQEEGRIRRYFTMKHAVDNKLPKIIEAVRKPGNRTAGGCYHSPATLAYLERVKFIDSCWIHLGLHQ